MGKIMEVKNAMFIFGFGDSRPTPEVSNCKEVDVNVVWPPQQKKKDGREPPEPLAKLPFVTSSDDTNEEDKFADFIGDLRNAVVAGQQKRGGIVYLQGTHQPLLKHIEDGKLQFIHIDLQVKEQGKCNVVDDHSRPG